MGKGEYYVTITLETSIIIKRLGVRIEHIQEVLTHNFILCELTSNRAVIEIRKRTKATTKDQFQKIQNQESK